MTIAGLETGGPQEDHTRGSGLYHMSLARMEQLNRSAVHLIATRLTEACPSFDKPVHEMAVSDLIGEIKEFHADSHEFIRYDMPIKEIVFRTLLARGNEPMSLPDLHHELTGLWSNALRPISLDQSLLRRVLDADTYYGFAEV
jgi:hypothetical protein